MEWIKTTERLPETKDAGTPDYKYKESDRVLIFSETGGIEIGFYAHGDDEGGWEEWATGGDGFDVYPYNDGEVTDWMPLPEKPKS